jgi:glutaminyl-peptide cyclotransferase
MRPMALWTALAMAIITGCTGNTQNRPSSSREPLAMPVPAFSGREAFTFLVKQTDFGPRNPNSAGHEACLSYLVTTLRTLADTVRLQTFSHPGYGGETLILNNVVASFRPADTRRMLLCAHWDTRPRAEQDREKSKQDKPILGANDGASGVAVLLELASLLKTTPPPIGVDIVLFDGEDYGMRGELQEYFLGSRHFAKNKPSDYVPRFGILLDMVGDRYLEIPKEQNSVRFAPDIVDLVWNTARELGIAEFVAQVDFAVEDDHLPLNEAGIKTIDIIDFNYPDPTNRFWHTHEDTPEKCSPESLQAVGTVITHVVYKQRP